MRLLHLWDDHVRRRVLAETQEPIRRGNHSLHGRQRLPLRREPTHRGRDQGRRKNTSRSSQMKALDEFQIEAERYELSEPLPYQFDLDRREFFKLLGGGLVVLCFVAPVLGQESGNGGRRGGGRGGQIPSDVNAWLHIGE